MLNQKLRNTRSLRKPSYKDGYFVHNLEQYGNAIRVTKNRLHVVNTILATVIPIVYPVPLALFINKLFFKKDLVIRY